MGAAGSRGRLPHRTADGTWALAVDCYAGGAALLAAAKATGRRWLATEQDETTALIARRRLEEM